MDLKQYKISPVELHITKVKFTAALRGQNRPEALLPALKGFVPEPIHPCVDRKLMYYTLTTLLSL